MSYRPKPCAGCGAVFIPGSGRARYCDQCRLTTVRSRALERQRRSRARALQREQDATWGDGVTPVTVSSPQPADLRKRRPNCTDSTSDGIWPPADPWARAFYERNTRWGVTA